MKELSGKAISRIVLSLCLVVAGLAIFSGAIFISKFKEQREQEYYLEQEAIGYFRAYDRWIEDNECIIIGHSLEKYFVKYPYQYRIVDVSFLALDSQLTGEDVKEFQKLRHLRVLDLARVKISDDCADEIAKLTWLKKLILHKDLISEESLARIQNAMPGLLIEAR